MTNPHQPADAAVDQPPDRRRWFVWLDDTVDNPSCPLTRDEAVGHFQAMVEDDEDCKVEIRQCTHEDLAWAGYDVEAPA